MLFDPSIPLYGVDSRVNLAVAAYLQTFSLWGRTANILVELPYQWSTTWGILVDTPARGSVSGFGDPAATLTLNLLGAPAMTPADLQALRKDPHPIVGASQRYLTALITVDADNIKAFAEERGITTTSLDELLQSQEVNDLIRSVVEEENAQLALFDTIKDFRLLPEFSIENGLLTPTLKVKRNLAMERFADVIEEMYREG